MRGNANAAQLSLPVGFVHAAHGKLTMSLKKNMHKTDPAVNQGRLRQQASLPKAIYSEGKIIQEMKTMNEIQSDQEGIVREICVEDSSMVEYGQVLIVLGEIE